MIAAQPEVDDILYRATIEYDGTDFAGYQYQNGQRSVQAEIEAAIEKLAGQTIRIAGAGRTDSGVHALGQVISFEVDTSIPTEKLAVAMNSVMPKDVSVREAWEAEPGFHARFSAESRTYVYAILNRPQRSAVYTRYSWHMPYALNFDAMRRGAASLVGEADFVAWANGETETRTTVRRIIRCGLVRRRDFIVLRIEANAFLRGMVRNIVGTLVEIGSGKRPAEDVIRITASRDRREAGPSAPPQGLCLVRVKYPAQITQQRRD